MVNDLEGMSEIVTGELLARRFGDFLRDKLTEESEGDFEVPPNVKEYFYYISGMRVLHLKQVPDLRYPFFIFCYNRQLLVDGTEWGYSPERNSMVLNNPLFAKDIEDYFHQVSSGDLLTASFVPFRE